SCRPKSSQFNLAQAKRVGDHADRAEAHGGGGDHGAEEYAEHGIEHAGRNGHTEGVIDKSPEQVLADDLHGCAAEADGTRHAAQVALDEGDVAALHGDVRAGAHGDSYVGLSERGRVVDTVAGKGNSVSFGLQALHDFQLPVGEHLGFEVAQAELVGDCLRGAAAVAGEHDDPDSKIAKHAERLGSGGLYRIRHTKHPGELTVKSNRHDGLAITAQLLGAVFENHVRCDSQLLQQAFVADRHCPALNTPHDAAAGQ